MISVTLSLKLGQEAGLPFTSVAEYLSQYEDVEVLSAAVPYMASAMMPSERLTMIRTQMRDVLSVAPLRSVQLLTG